MKNHQLFDQIMKESLAPTYTPSQNLNTRLKQQIKEKTNMKVKRTWKVGILAACMVVTLSATAFAAWHLLSSSDIATELGYPILAEAFQSDDALLINETKSQKGYDISFLGIVSGKGLTSLDETINQNSSYAVVAIEKQSGKMPAISDDDFGKDPFFVSPLIKGQQPWLYNIASMGGGYSTCVIDGVMYRLIECGDLEMFADRGLSLIVSSTNFYSIEAYDYDEATGLVTPNSKFDGINLMFDLPLDPTKGDYEKAQGYLDSLWNHDEDSNVEEDFEEGEDLSIRMNSEGEFIIEK